MQILEKSINLTGIESMDFVDKITYLNNQSAIWKPIIGIFIFLFIWFIFIGIVSRVRVGKRKESLIIQPSFWILFSGIILAFVFYLIILNFPFYWEWV